MKYQKIKGSWTYGHIVIPVGLIYIGSSKAKECSYRWSPSDYKTTSLQPYIEKYGWDNIQHIVFKDGLTKEQALQLEDLLIEQATIDGWCINKQRSGGKRWCSGSTEKVEYDKKYYKKHKDENKEKCRKYYQEHKDEIIKKTKEYQHKNKESIKEKKKIYQKEHREERINYLKAWRSTPEGKIYIRVSNYNHNHTPIETPMEAKQKYLETGYIPNYIKNNDII